MLVTKLVHLTLFGVCAGSPAIDGTYHDNLTVYTAASGTQRHDFCVDAACTHKLRAIWEASEDNKCGVFARAYQTVDGKDETVPFLTIVGE